MYDKKNKVYELNGTHGYGEYTAIECAVLFTEIRGDVLLCIGR